MLTLITETDGTHTETIPSPFPSDGSSMGIVTGKLVTALPKFPIRKLGEGVFGNVYSFHDGARLRAAKVTKDPLLSQRGGVDLNYFIEAINMGGMGRHPNVVKMVDCVLTSISTIIVFERESTSLDLLMKEYPRSVMPLTLTKKLALDIAKGMEYILLHTDLLHSDYKPSNILIRKLPDGERVAKIADFGIARMYKRRCRPEEYEEVFTLWWRAPEILMERPYTPAADVWAFGCILVEMLTGKTPFKGTKAVETLAFIFWRFGLPTEESWPGVKKIPAFSTPIIKQAAVELNIGSLEGLEVKFTKAMNEDGTRHPLPKEERRIVDAILKVNPDDRPSISQVVDNVWFDSVRGVDESRPVELNRIDILREYAASQKVYRITNNHIKGRVYSIILHRCREGGVPGKTRGLTIYLFERYMLEAGVRETGDWDRDRSVFIPIIDQCLTFAGSVVVNYPNRYNSSNALEKDMFTRLGTDTFVKSTSYDFLFDISTELEVSEETVYEAKRLLQLSYFTDASLELDPESVAYAVIAASGKITKDKNAVVPAPFRWAARKMSSLIAKELKVILGEWSSSSGVLSLYASKSELASTIKQTGFGECITVEDIERSEVRVMSCVY